MKVEIIKVELSQKSVIENLYPLYLHDLSEFSNEDVDDHGRFIREEGLDIWWEKEVLFPFMIRADANIAGFILVCAAPHVSRGRDYRLNDFFILRKYRRRGVGYAAAVSVFDCFQGHWELSWIPSNIAAATFWKKTVEQYTSGNYEEGLVMESAEQGILGLHFRNM